MSTKRTAHIISHTHWDREWYLPYEKHHVRLVKLVDTLLDKMDQDPNYRSFFLDGQTIILEDYLQVRPDQKDRLTKFIQDGRILIGPWYILQDAFLTSGEANVRNMQIGHQDAKKYGDVSKIGYFPDTFGLVGQTPQLMQQSGITNALFGRGVKPTGFNNTVSDGDYESSFSELLWEGPDGSQVLGILFANWYSNGNEIPVDREEAKAYWERKLADAEKYASTGELLFMNGCDHQPVQLDLPEAIQAARELYPDTNFVHSNFIDYLQAVQRSLKHELSTVKGELRSQRTDGWSTLVNTASARVYLKQMNQLGQAMLEKVAEPLAAFAHVLEVGEKYPHHLFTYAWKTLMQNHPHDSICGCSVDEVHREMVTRFEKSRHVAEAIVDDSKRAIAEAIDTSSFAQAGENALPVVVFNTTGWERTGVVSIELDALRLYFRDGYTLEEASSFAKAADLSGRTLVDELGNVAACTFEDLGLQFGYDLPDDKFRQPYMCRKVKLTFEAEKVPALGLKTYAWVKREEETVDSSLLAGDRVLENESLKVVIADNGSFTLTDKKNGRTYRDLGVYENTGDIGNEYMYKQPDGETPLTTQGLAANIRVLKDTPYQASFEIVHDWEIPASADELLEEEQRDLIYFPHRKAQRSARMVPMQIRTIISLSRGGKGVEIEASFNNQAKDHRLRMLFPSDLNTQVHRVDSMFEIPQRDNTPSAEWENPSNTQHQQAFIDVSEAEAGLVVANLGLNEYEVLRDRRNTIAVTLLRAVGELGDWGLFPTPEAQCLGEHTVRMTLIPYNGEGEQYGAYQQAYQFQIPWTLCQTGIHTGRIAPTYAPFHWEGDKIGFSSMKMNEGNGDLMLRWYNMSSQNTELKLSSNIPLYSFYKSTIMEVHGPSIEADAEGQLSLPTGPCEIVTVGIQR
ncbi:alpha-mannosidase [Paenibacillus alginolyticus]|uniref:Alpha-mannosidase n=1 Tax=Paenibacillus alginolyticus TaxID=59839 RepID=A0ABT4GGZ1_9BACL|nr:alpha-mannosidase [Paenibacillus alginolyticus]MCY9695334.1 alpha-mannosidase [Paenibacillus alginolyticus]MEC0144774.1 alpha-mannosidase [Paenibacillus alginolyticus]